MVSIEDNVRVQHCNAFALAAHLPFKKVGTLGGDVPSVPVKLFEVRFMKLNEDSDVGDIQLDNGGDLVGVEGLPLLTTVGIVSASLFRRVEKGVQEEVSDLVRMKESEWTAEAYNRTSTPLPPSPHTSQSKVHCLPPRWPPCWRRWR